MFWEDKSKRRIVLISVALIMLLAVFFWFKKNSKTVSNFLVTKGLDYIKKDLDGELLYQGLNSNIENGEFKIHFDSLEILDKQRIQALEAQKLDIVWSLANILGREQVINHISARSLLINAIRDNSGKWNLTGILRPKKKRFSFKFKNVDFPNVIVDLQDIMSFKEIKHNVISIKLESKNLEDIYQVWILANPPKAYNDSTLVDDYSSLTAIDSQNFIRVKGEIDLSEQNRVLQKNKLTFHIANLNMLNLNFLLDLINNYKSQEINSLFNKYAHEANLNLFGQIDSSNKDSKKIFFKSVIYNLYHIPQLLLDIDLDYMSDKDLIFKKFIMQFFNSSIQLSGRINNFDNDNENYQIKGSIKSLNVLDLLNKIDELRQAQYLAFIGLLEGLKIAENMNLTLDFSGNKSGYNIVSAIDLANQKDLIIKGSINSKLLTINQFTVPIDFAKVSMSGQYNLDSKFYDLNLESSDLPLDKAKLFLQNFEFFNKYSEYFAKALVGGYSSFSLNIKKSSQGESFPVLLNGFIKFAKTFYYTEALKIPIQNLTTKLDIKDNYIDIPQLSSFIGTSYIEAKGNFKLGQLNSLNLELASPKINLASFNSSEFFNSLTEKHRLANLTGIIDNFYFKVSQNTDYKAYGDLNDISFVVDDAFRIKNLNGKTAYDHKSLKFKNLKFKINDSSQVNLLGQIDDDFKLPKLVITAKDLDLGEISKFDFLSSQYHLAPNSGKLDADLFLNGQKLVGSVDLKHCDFSFKDHPKFKYP
ncbi:MAG: hypothetical protein LW817_07080, partial [Candidatus Caenarcaniphilales bacterium]|nr:hypothetical protein [Candidatus Caenarcaniphilales bacterium]